MTLTWIEGSREDHCVPCGGVRSMRAIFAAVDAAGEPMEGVRCAECGNITIVGAGLEPATDEATIDGYLEAGAGIEAILRNLHRVEAPAGATFLDVGANAGFAVRYAQERLGWKAIGIEPSPAGARGARDLGVTIIPRRLERSAPLADRFDVILASEVIEHTPAPSDFALALREHLAPGGRVILTTPAAECVTPGSPGEARQAIGGGEHLLLLSEQGLRRMLQDAGFGSVLVEREDATLVAVAAVEPDVALSLHALGPSADDVIAFLGAIAEGAPLGSVLRTSMIVRRFRAAVNRGVATAEDERAAFDAVRMSTGLDLSRPAAALAAPADNGRRPRYAPSALFAAAMRRVVAAEEWDRAIEYFDAAEALIRERRDAGERLDGDALLIERESIVHRLLALVHTEPERAARALRRRREAGELSQPEHWTLRLFIEASAIGSGASFAGELGDVVVALGVLMASDRPDDARISLDAAYLLAREATERGDRWTATQWCSVAEGLLDSADPALIRSASRSVGALLDELRERIVMLDPEVIPSEVPLPRRVHDHRLWRGVDEHGIEGQVTVVMPFYRGGDYAIEALESIAMQSRPPLEVIVVDDGSPDDSVERLRRLSLPFELRIVRQRNAGQSAARNAGIREARGEFIAFLDQDDAWRPDHLARLVKTLESDPSLGWVFGDFDLIDGSGRTVVSTYLRTHSIQLERRSVAEIVRSDLMALPSASALRKRALVRVGGFDRRLCGYEDDELYLRLFRAGWSVRADLRVRARYRVHGANASSSVAFLRSRLIFLEMLFDEHPGVHGMPSAGEASVERMLRSTVTDYVTALVAGQLDLARTIAWVVSRLLSHAPGLSLPSRLGARLGRHPALALRALLLARRLPGRIRRRVLSPVAQDALQRLARTASPPRSPDLGARPQWMLRRG